MLVHFIIYLPAATEAPQTHYWNRSSHLEVLYEKAVLKNVQSQENPSNGEPIKLLFWKNSQILHEKSSYLQAVTSSVFKNLWRASLLLRLCAVISKSSTTRSCTQVFYRKRCPDRRDVLKYFANFKIATSAQRIY